MRRVKLEVWGDPDDPPTVEGVVLIHGTRAGTWEPTSPLMKATMDPDVEKLGMRRFYYGQGPDDLRAAIEQGATAAAKAIQED